MRKYIFLGVLAWVSIAAAQHPSGYSHIWRKIAEQKIPATDGQTEQVICTWRCTAGLGAPEGTHITVTEGHRSCPPPSP